MTTPKLQSESMLAPQKSEGYFPVSDAYLHVVTHYAENPVAQVLLVGPFASERHFSYHAWGQWARYLAAHGLQAVRFDYRGIGESTGSFEDFSFGDWLTDVRTLAAWCLNASPQLPLVLHGLEIGALLAAHSFQTVEAAGLLLWSPPKTANQALRATLVQWAGLEQLAVSTDNRTTASEYMRRLSSGSSIEVQGYVWSSRLWGESFELSLPSLEEKGVESDSCRYKRPVETTTLGRDAAPLVKPHLKFGEVPDLNWVYAPALEWIMKTVQPECFLA